MSQTTVGELNIRLNMELARLESQIKQANAKVKSAGASWNGDIGKAAKMINGTLATIGVGASLSGLIAYGKACIDTGGRITDLSSQANLSVTAFQNMELAAMENGTTGEEVAAVFAKLGNAIQDAVEDPAGKAAKAFDKLRLGASALKTMEGQQAYELLGRSIANASDKQEAYNALADILGQKIGPKQLQLLQAIAEVGYDNIAAGNEKLILSAEQIKRLADAGDKLERWGKLLVLPGAEAIVLVGAQIDPTDKEKIQQEISGLESMIEESQDSEGGIWSMLFGTDEEIAADIAKMEARITELRAKLTSMANETPGGVSDDPQIKALEDRARAAAEQNSLDAFNLSILKATTAAEKEEAEAKKAQAQADTAYNKSMAETNAKLQGYADSAIAAINPSHGLAEEIAGITAAADRNMISVADATAAIDKLKAAAVDAELPDFFGDLDAKSAANVKAINREMREMERLADDIGDAFGDSFQSAIMEGGKVGDMLKSLGRDILALIVRQSITSPIAGLVSGGISSMFGGLFGGGSSWGGAAAGMNTWQGSTSFGGYAATGGDVNPSEWYMVGEKGPEPFIPSTAGTIVSNSDLMSALGAERGGGTSITVVQNFAAGVSQSQLAESMRQTREAAKAGVMDAIQRRGGGFGMVAA